MNNPTAEYQERKKITGLQIIFDKLEKNETIIDLNNYSVGARTDLMFAIRVLKYEQLSSSEYKIKSDVFEVKTLLNSLGVK